MSEASSYPKTRRKLSPLLFPTLLLVYTPFKTPNEPHLSNLPSLSRFTGNLTITLERPNTSPTVSSTAMSISIPNHQLINPVYSADKNGVRYINDTSNLKIRLWTDPADTDESRLLVLGKAFLSGIYLLVDHDNSKFSLWESRPTNESEIVPLVSDKVCDASSSANKDSATFTTPNNAAGSPPSQSDGKPSSSVIAGSVIGALAALALILSLLFILLRRRARRRQQRVLAEQDAATAEANKAWWQWRLWGAGVDAKPELGSGEAKAELRGEEEAELSGSAPKSEMGSSEGSPAAEADPDGERRELEGAQWAHEMATGSRGRVQELGAGEGGGVEKELPVTPGR